MVILTTFVNPKLKQVHKDLSRSKFTSSAPIRYGLVIVTFVIHNAPLIYKEMALLRLVGLYQLNFINNKNGIAVVSCQQ